jgi:membrane fusion protein, multidrug efflux system
MSTWQQWTVGGLALVGVALGGSWWYSHRATSGTSPGSRALPSSPTATPSPVATVTVAPLQQSTITETLIVYGTVIAQLGEVRVVAVAYEARVGRVLVTAGQEVAAGTPLLDVQPSPATMLHLQEARTAVATAQKELEQTQQRYQQHLATNQELNTAQHALRTAEATLQSLQSSGAGALLQLKAEASGLVSKVDVQVGQIVPAGTPLVEVANRHYIEVQLGVEQEDASALRAGQPVRLTSVHSPAAPVIEGHIRLITERVNPGTRLIDVFVALPQQATLRLDEFVRGDLVKASAHGLVVPRQAVLPEAGQAILYTVTNQQAVKHVVTVGVQNNAQVQVEADGLRPGDPVVIVGNYVLQDGMAVQVEPPAPGSPPGAGALPSPPAPVHPKGGQ